MCLLKALRKKSLLYTIHSMFVFTLCIMKSIYLLWCRFMPLINVEHVWFYFFLMYICICKISITYFFNQYQWNPIHIVLYLWCSRSGWIFKIINLVYFFVFVFCFRMHVLICILHVLEAVPCMCILTRYDWPDNIILVSLSLSLSLFLSLLKGEREPM